MTAVAKLRDNLLVTAGMRIAYMDDLGIIDIPSGVEGENKISTFIANLIDNYPVGCDVNFDEYIERGIQKEYGPGDT